LNGRCADDNDGRWFAMIRERG